MNYSEEKDGFDELRTYFSPTEWNQLSSSAKTQYLNIMKDHLYKLSVGLKSVTPDFMTMDRSGETTGQEKVSLLSPAGQEDIPEVKDGEQWALHLSRGHLEAVALYPGDRTLQKQTYTEPEVLEHRVNRTTPQRFDVRQSHIQDGGLGVFYYGYSELPVLGTHFGPYEGLKTDDLYCQILRNGPIQPCQQLTFTIAGQKPGDAVSDELRGYSLPFNKTLTQLTYTGKKAQICKQCDKTFNHLEKHQCVLTGEKPFSCNQCEKSFSKLSNLNRHQRVHTGNKPFHCKQCDKNFSQYVHLKKHERLHTGEKPYRCKQCEKSFSRHDSLKRHQQLHTGERPFQCKQCERRFSQLGVLKTHQRLHTGERPFHCKECDKSFSQLGTLKSHQRLHTGEKPFKCKQCEKSFSQLGVLNRHQRVHAARKNALNRLRISPIM